MKNNEIKKILNKSKSKLWQNTQPEEIDKVYKYKGKILIDTVIFSPGFTEDGCTQNDCTKDCLGCSSATRTNQNSSYAPADIANELWELFGEQVEE